MLCKENGQWQLQILRSRSPQWEPDSEVWETTTDSAQPMMFGTLDVKSVVRNTEKTFVQYKGQEWINFNYDTRTATAAPLVELAEGLPLHKVGAFIVANGQDIPNFGRAKFSDSRRGWQQAQDGRNVTEVHKPVESESEISKYHDAFIFEEVGALVHSQTQPSCRRPTTRVSSIVSASWLSWNSTSASRRKIVQLLFETCGKIGDGHQLKRIKAS